MENEMDKMNDVEKIIDQVKHKKILKLSTDTNECRIFFNWDHEIIIKDERQLCCEERYLQCDDDLSIHTNSFLFNIELLKAEAYCEEEKTLEVNFVRITTSTGSFTLSYHNNHNGNYEGFDLEIQYTQRRKIFNDEIENGK